MKRNLVSILCIFLCLTMLAATPRSVSAETFAAGNLPNPTVTLLTGAPDYTATVIPIGHMPGVTTMASGTFVPVGYETGEKQFEGSGLELTGFNYGSASLCFPLHGTASGWGGQVGKWNGSKWELLATSITPPSGDDSYAWACSVIYSDGSYAFIKWIADADLLTKSKPDCGYPIVMLWTNTIETVDHGDYMTGSVDAFYILQMGSPVDLTGQTVTITVSSDPKSAFSMSRPMRGTLYPSIAGSFAADLSTPVDFVQYISLTSFTIHFDFGTCVQDLVFSGT
jgi:hypothetical protein